MPASDSDNNRKASQFVSIEIDGRAIRVSNLDKVLYPTANFTKADVIDYYVRIAPAILPHLDRRPLTLKRYPQGAQAEFFYEKQCPSHAPDWMTTVTVWSETANREINFCVVDSLAALVWVANLASIELHTSLSQAQAIDTPTMMVFDLDPGAPADILDCAQVAGELRELLRQLGLESFVKTSGGKGLHLCVPLNTPVSYDQTKSTALALAQILQRRDPARVTTNMKKEMRKGKVFVDWSQNVQHKTTVCVYSLRAGVRPTVSMPIDWELLEEARAKDDVSMMIFEANEAIQIVEQHGDLFQLVLKLQQQLPKVGVEK